MAGIDKAAIGVAIAITAIFLGVAATMDAAQNAGPVDSAPIVSKTIEPTAQDETPTKPM